MSGSTLALPVPVALERSRFYFRMAVACFAVAVAGFAPTYWIPLVGGTLSVPPLVHIHAVFFYGWTLLFMRQTWLASRGAIARHRELGIAGVALATGMCFLGLWVAINGLKQFEAAGFGETARAFSIVSVTGILLFGALFGAAVVFVKNPDIHKRLMLVATVSVLQAAIARWFAVFLATPGPGGIRLPPPVAVSVMPGLVSDLLIVWAMIHDRNTRGRVHPVYWIAGGVLLAVQLLRVPLSSTAGWHRITEWMLALAP
ncbi:MAG: hypothetical protein IPM24_14810 [Bryobacterales bacterium]|nr:hypothetical protein [Bryobacterales bacterium]